MKKNRAFLKWAGGKFPLVEEIHRYLPQGDCLIEPFVGAGSVFLNTDFDRYHLADINNDLINLYNIVKTRTADFIRDARLLLRLKGIMKPAITSSALNSISARMLISVRCYFSILIAIVTTACVATIYAASSTSLLVATANHTFRKQSYCGLPNVRRKQRLSVNHTMLP